MTCSPIRGPHRQAVLARPLADIVVAADVFTASALEDETFPRGSWPVSAVDADAVVCAAESARPARRPNYVHTDRDMGEWTALLYLNPQPAPGDGTTFWRTPRNGHSPGSDAGDDTALLEERQTWRDLAQWEPVWQIAAKWGRRWCLKRIGFTRGGRYEKLRTRR